MYCDHSHVVKLYYDCSSCGVGWGVGALHYIFCDVHVIIAMSGPRSCMCVCGPLFLWNLADHRFCIACVCRHIVCESVCTYRMANMHTRLCIVLHCMW